MGSRRLPEKVVRDLGGRPLLAHLLDGLRHTELTDAVIATTSSERSDDRVAELCRAEEVECFRGPLDDVNLRMLEAAEQYDLQTVVRISGDSPLLDQRLVDRAVALFREGGHDLVTNVFPRSFPRGQSVEVFDVAVLRRVRAGSSSPEELEHVTAPIYQHPEWYRIVNFSHVPNLEHINMSVDTAEDAARVDRLLRSLSRPRWSYPLDELVERWLELDAST